MEIVKTKKDMIKKIKFFNEYIYNDMLKHIEEVDYFDLLTHYRQNKMIYEYLKQFIEFGDDFDDRNSS